MKQLILISSAIFLLSNCSLIQSNTEDLGSKETSNNASAEVRIMDDKNFRIIQTD